MDCLVQVCRRTSLLERSSPAEGLDLRFHRVLQYQLYLEYEREVVEEQIIKPKCIKNSSIAIDRVLAELYSDDWVAMKQEIKEKRRSSFHYQKAFGKRLQILCDFLGYGVLLLGSQAAMRAMQVAPIRKFDLSLT